MNYSNRKASLAMVSGLFVIDIVWMFFSNLRFDWTSISFGASIPVLLILMAWFYTYIRPSERISNLSIDAAILIVFSHVGCIFSYLVSANGGALQDELMVAVDHYLGFDWHAYTRYFLKSDILRIASKFFYALTLLFVVFTIAWFSLTGKINRSREFLSTIILGAIVSIILSGIIPTAGGAGYFAPDNDFYMGYKIMVDTHYMQDFFDLRNGADVLISLTEPKGLISFPSYHACMAVLVILAFWGEGLLFWVMLLLNFCVIATTPVEGGHHLSDVLGGIVVALVIFVVVRRLTVRTDQAANG